MKNILPTYLFEEEYDKLIDAGLELGFTGNPNKWSAAEKRAANQYAIQKGWYKKPIRDEPSIKNDNTYRSIMDSLYKSRQPIKSLKASVKIIGGFYYYYINFYVKSHKINIALKFKKDQIGLIKTDKNSFKLKIDNKVVFFEENYKSVAASQLGTILGQKIDNYFNDNDDIVKNISNRFLRNIESYIDNQKSKWEISSYKIESNFSKGKYPGESKTTVKLIFENLFKYPKEIFWLDIPRGYIPRKEYGVYNKVTGKYIVTITVDTKFIKDKLELTLIEKGNLSKLKYELGIFKQSERYDSYIKPLDSITIKLKDEKLKMVYSDIVDEATLSATAGRTPVEWWNEFRKFDLLKKKFKKYY